MAVFTANKVDGAAVWLHPNTTIPFSGALRAGLLLMPFRFGWQSFRRSTSFGSYLERLRQRILLAADVLEAIGSFNT